MIPYIKERNESAKQVEVSIIKKVSKNKITLIKKLKCYQTHTVSTDNKFDIC